MTEVWKTIEDYPDYAISNLSRVKRIVDSRTYKAGYLRKCQKDKNGYITVTLRNNVGDKTLKIHRLMLEAFKGKSSLQTNHKDGNKSNNDIDNLEWVTASENISHAFRTGLITPNKGESHSNTKLNNDKVLIIRHMHPMYSYSEIADMFNINQSHVGRIINRETWTHI